VLLNDRMDDREAQPTAFADAPGREEGVEDSRQVSGRNARPAIADRQAQDTGDGGVDR
jgi:hypothetical protein